MLTVTRTADLAPYVGIDLTPSAWRVIDAERIQRFADISDERHWIHTDADRVRRETSFPGLVAHGFLTASLLTSMAGECVRIERADRILNYGMDKLRFTEVVTAGDRVRLRLKLIDIKSNADGGQRLTWGCTMEIEGKSRPALVADFLWLVMAEPA